MNTEFFADKQFVHEWVTERNALYTNTNPHNIDMSTNGPFSEGTNVSPSPFVSLILDYKDRITDLSNINHFIETGTCSGMTAMAFAAIIDHVNTVDIRSWTDYKNLKDKHTNITFWEGTSTKFLETLIPTIPDEQCIFLLDAHDGTNIVPLEEELRCIKTLSAINNHVIIIDDCIDCGVQNFPPIDKLKELLYDINSKYTIENTGGSRHSHIAFV